MNVSQPPTTPGRVRAPHYHESIHHTSGPDGCKDFESTNNMFLSVARLAFNAHGEHERWLHVFCHGGALLARTICRFEPRGAVSTVTVMMLLVVESADESADRGCAARVMPTERPANEVSSQHPLCQYWPRRCISHDAKLRPVQTTPRRRQGPSLHPRNTVCPCTSKTLLLRGIFHGEGPRRRPTRAKSRVALSRVSLNWHWSTSVLVIWGSVKNCRKSLEHGYTNLASNTRAAQKQTNRRTPLFPTQIKAASLPDGPTDVRPLRRAHCQVLRGKTQRKAKVYDP